MEPVVPSTPMGAGSISSFGVEVVDYACVGDENSYSNHIFTIRVWVDQLMFTINRTYAAFCEFDAQLRRKYPRTTIQPLPLSGATVYARRASVKVPSGSVTPDAKSAALDLRASMLGGFQDDTPKGKQKPAVRRADKAEVISLKKSPLNGYLNSLLTLPEVLLSDNLLYFLDEESPDGQILAAQTKEVSEVDILLADEVPIAKTVLRELKIPMNLDPGSVIVWSFSTKHYDIGFSITFNNAMILPYQRYNSFTEAVSGSIQITDQGKLMLVWDNKYSKMRSKQLSFVIKVFRSDEYEAAKSIASEAAKEKSQKSQQRGLLKRALAQGSKELYSVNNQGGRIAPLLLTSGSGSSGSGEGSTKSVLPTDDDAIASEFNRLRDEKRSLQRALSEAEAALVEERHASACYLDRIEDLIAQRDVAEKELVFLRGNNEDGAYGFGRKESNATERGNKSSFGSESETLSLRTPTVDIDDNSSSGGDGRTDLLTTPSGSVGTPNDRDKNGTEQLMIQEADSEQEAKNALYILQLQEQIATLSETVENLKNKLSVVKEDQATAEYQVSKLKAEKKALKEYAIKLKSENEQQLVVITELNEEIAQLKSSVENLVAISDAIKQSESVLASSINAAPVQMPSELSLPEANHHANGAEPMATGATASDQVTEVVSPNPTKVSSSNSIWGASSSFVSQIGSLLGGGGVSPNGMSNGMLDAGASVPTASPALDPAGPPIVKIVSGDIAPPVVTLSQVPSSSALSTESNVSSVTNSACPTPAVPNSTPAVATPEVADAATTSAVSSVPSAAQSASANSPLKKSKFTANRKSRASIAAPSLFVDDLGF
jgi:hypothetical protein